MLTPLQPGAAAGPEGPSSCIDACYACAQACDRCVVANLQQPQPRHLARCIALCIDCAQACRLAAAYLARASEHDGAACALAAMLCGACAAECDEHAGDHCRACAVACRRCADECAAMSARPHAPAQRGAPDAPGAAPGR